MNVIDILPLVVSGGLVILIWMVQLLVYPSFTFYTKENLALWHTTYTPRITIIVAPLMLAQLGIAILRLYSEIGLFTVANGVLVAATWLTTFFVFIPIHDRIQKDEYSQKLLYQLVSLNWIRTVLWTLIFILEFLFAAT